MIETTIEKLPGSEIEIKGELPYATVISYKAEVLAHLNEKGGLDGFRPGHIPESVLEKTYGEVAILQAMAEEAIHHAYPEIVEKEKIDPIGRPLILITKLAKDNPVGFTIKTAVMPTLTLPNYRKMAKEVMGSPDEKIETTDDEVSGVLKELSQMRKKDETDLVVIDDAFAKSLGNFESLEALKTRIKENILTEKTIKARDKKRVTLMEQIVTGASGDIPAVMIENEADRMLRQLQADVERAGVTWEDYEKKTGNNEAKLKAEWRDDATKRVKAHLAIEEIAKAEELKPDEAEVAKETDRILQNYEGADPERAKLYAEGIFLNEAVLQFLENLK